MQLLRLLCAVSVLFVMVLIGPPALGLETSVGESEWAAAQKSLLDLKTFMQQTIKELGPQRGIELLDTYGIQLVDEIAQIRLERDDAMKVYRVDFGQLKKYQQGTNPITLLVDANRIIFPVKVGENVRSSLTMSKSKNGTWQNTARGLANLTKLLSSYKRTDSDIAVSIVEMNLYFVGTEIEKERNFKLISLGTIPKFALVSGKPEPAENVFLSLQPQAKAYKGGLR